MSESLSTPTLPSFSWIGHLKPDDRDLLSSYGEFFPGHPGNVIIEEGTEQTQVIVVISGRLEVRSTQEDGTSALLAEISPGETLGEICLFDPGPATATVTATEFSQLWRIADDDLIQFMGDNPGAGNLLLRTLATILARRLRQVDPKAYGLSSYAVIDSPELPSALAASPESRLSPPPSSDPATTPAVTLSPAHTPLEVQPSLSSMMQAAGQPIPSPVPKRPSNKTQAISDPDELEPL